MHTISSALLILIYVRAKDGALIKKNASRGIKFKLIISHALASSPRPPGTLPPQHFPVRQALLRRPFPVLIALVAPLVDEPAKVVVRPSSPEAWARQRPSSYIYL